MPDYLRVYDSEDPLRIGVVWKVHVSFAYSYIILNRQGGVTENISYAGEYAISHFVQRIQQKWRHLRNTVHYYALSMLPIT